MPTYNATIKKIISKKLPLKLRREEAALLHQIDDQAGFLESTRVTITYDSADKQIKYSINNCAVPIEVRQLIDMLLRGWSTVPQIKSLQNQ
jgi:hypothetical protein